MTRIGLNSGLRVASFIRIFPIRHCKFIYRIYPMLSNTE
jgi:hypothetical protein